MQQRGAGPRRAASGLWIQGRRCGWQEVLDRQKQVGRNQMLLGFRCSEQHLKSCSATDLSLQMKSIKLFFFSLSLCSWSEKWGDQGYIYMAKDRKNNCGVATAASYPLA